MYFLSRLVLSPLIFFSYCLQGLGRDIFAWLGIFLGSLLFFLGFRKKVVMGNLELALGKELALSERENLAKKIYWSIGTVFLEIARNFSLSPGRMRAELLLSPEDAARLDAIKAQGRGAIFLSGHIANWELLAMGMAAYGYPVSIVVKRMNNALSQALIERQRLRTGIEVIYSGGTLEKMKQSLARGRMIGFMVDQNITGTRGIRADFFGVPAASIRGLANLVRETGTAVIPLCAYRRTDGRLQVTLLEELPYLEAPEYCGEERFFREEWLNTQKYQSAVEAMVRERPEQWLWIHRRWKANRSPLDPQVAHRENMAR